MTRRPGIQLAVGIMFTVLACTGLGYFQGPTSDLRYATAVFLLSLIAFTIAAALTFSSAIFWRMVDYPWVGASLMALFFAIANVQVADWKQEFSRAKIVMKSEISSFATNLHYIAEERCTRIQLSELQHGLCDRIPRVIELAQDQIVGIDEEDYAPNDVIDWGLQFSTGATMNPLILKGDTMTTLGLSQGLDILLRAQAVFQHAWEKDRQRDTSWQRRIVKIGLPYWQLILAFFVGLRLSKTTAEVLQEYSRRRQSRP